VVPCLWNAVDKTRSPKPRFPAYNLLNATVRAVTSRPVPCLSIMHHQTCTDIKWFRLNYSFVGCESCIKIPTFHLNVSSRPLVTFLLQFHPNIVVSLLLSIELCITGWRLPVADSREHGNELLNSVTS
jgi:hypothetical protein